MTRLTFALASWISLVSVASASLASHQGRLYSANDTFSSSVPRLPAVAREQAAGQGTTPEYAVTERTEILLDGRPCRYEAVPRDAAIERMIVAPDRKTVLRVYFLTGK